MTTGSSRYRAILLFGMPGSGKGTQGQILGQLPDLVHVSCGDIFRKLPKHGELYKEILRYSSKGQLVPDDLTVRIWHQYVHGMELMQQLSPEYHILVLDGLPRNYRQAELIDGFLDVIQIFNLRITDKAKAIERLKARALRENRLDDANEEVIERRMQVYYEETEQTLRFYKAHLIFDVDASQTPLDVLRQIIDRLSEVSHQHRHPRAPGLEDLTHSGL